MGSAKQDFRMKIVNFHQEDEKSINFSNDLFPLSETLLENGRYMELFKSRQGLKGRFQIEWLGNKCSEDLTHHCKRAAQNIADTSLAVHSITIQCTLSNKNLHGRVTRKNDLNTKHLKNAK